MSPRRRIGVTAAVATVAALALAGCSGTSSSPSSPAAAGSTITVWADDTHIAALKTVVATFEKANNVTVKLIQKDGAKIVSDFIQQAPTGNGPDVFVTANDGTGNLVQNGVIAPITIPNESDYAKVGIDAVTYNGKTYGMPVSLESVALIQNTALDPTTHDTFDQLLAAGNKLKAAGKVKYPFVVQSGTNGASDPYHLYPLETSFGVPVFGTSSAGGYDSTDLQLGNAQGTKWAAQLAAWGKSGVLNPNYTYDIALNAFTSGQTPYIITGPWSLPKIQAAKIAYSVVKIPSAGGQPSQPFVGVQAFFVNKYSKNSLLANKFAVEYMGSEAAQVAFYKTGQRAPALLSAFQSVSSDKDVTAFGAVSANGAPLPNIPAMNSVWADWGNTEGAIIAGKAANPATAWTTMVGSIKAAIAKG
ncbi:sugar ABC transporter substrate-binding protein [Galbitalea soli]|uniref:Maltose ABC transporter substrate-binding protein n=1 Tax=Galbitalea soli TaxID=1268042 RepID=A0A7C9PMP5_9MICO|nr:maltose ABC transporter substrate-binding protein [Galbitalea soli]NEM90931.1 maltose ABC transporter substrate-binding protein [Galbitalea soli]NYJ29617.1 arabinogalactan oligomer/maltooligosaccharide transport system substrate-binding protein [Galbitalea soli]